MVASVQSENEYDDLLAMWSDLESGLGIILSNPANTQEFAHRVLQYDRWMQGLMRRDPDVGLYLLFQLSSNSPVGYSASHALVCAVLCHMIASELRVTAKDRDSLVRAALSMNIAMTALQDTLSTQVEKPDKVQQDIIRAHSIKGAMMLANLGVSDDNWLDIVSQHHDDGVDRVEPALVNPAIRLTRILKTVDRYSAMISPRMSRAGRSATESARAILATASEKSDEIGHALVRSVGLYPPGTYVRLDNDEVAVVVRRSERANHPFVAIIGQSNGELLRNPRLHSTADNVPRIHSALAASAVRAQLNHFQILQLSTYSAKQA